MNVRKTTLEDRATQPMNQDGLDEHLSKLIRQKNSTNIKKQYNYWDGYSTILGDLQLCGDDKHKVVQTAFAPC